MKEKPVVSVICITYGHEEYIAQALDSFLMQKTNFPYQILVGEDKGPDRTAEIVMEYAEKYPDRIVPFIREKNMGAQRNLIDLCRRAGTKYVAFCEGDDFWIDEYKLQKQYDFMEAHPEYRACFHNTRIQTDTSWYLYNYYISDNEGNIYLPESIPNYDTSLREMRMDYYIKFGPAHTSSLFYRWDNDREIPEWYYRHIYGDHSLVMIQVGDGLIGYIPETMSVYRRSEVGVLMYGSKTEHFLRSRESWIEMACDLEEYFKEHFNTFANEEIRARIVQEFNSYTRFLVTAGKEDKLKDVYSKYTYPASLAAVENVQNYRNFKILEGLYSEDGVKWLLKEESVQKEVQNIINEKLAYRSKKLQERIAAYTGFAARSKDPAIWVFSQEDRYNFGGNVRHLYEYILAYHPEIKPVWLTRNKDLIKLFVSEGMPHAKIGTSACTEIMKKASVAFVDKYRTKAYNLKGFNKGIKLVRLGEGIPITDFYNDPEFALEPQLSPEATAELVIGCDRQKYRDVIIDDENRGYFTENYKDVFIQLAPNKRIAEIYAEKYGIPEESIYICGSPRSYAVPDRLGDRRRKILMIPADRQDLSEQEIFFDELSENMTQIEEFLEQENKYLTICFFRTFSKEFVKRIEGVTDIYERIEVVGWERDIFHDMPGYEAMITDGSELMYDFALQDKPIVIINTERDADRLKEKLLYDYDDILPGHAAADWKSGLGFLKEAIADPAKDRALRKKALETVCDLSVNDEENSERIIQEVKRRLKGLE